MAGNKHQVIKDEIGRDLMHLMRLLEGLIVPQAEQQNLICIPRVGIASLGMLYQDYYISKCIPKIL